MVGNVLPSPLTGSREKAGGNRNLALLVWHALGRSIRQDSAEPGLASGVGREAEAEGAGALGLWGPAWQSYMLGHVLSTDELCRFQGWQRGS